MEEKSSVWKLFITWFSDQLNNERIREYEFPEEFHFSEWNDLGMLYNNRQSSKIQFISKLFIGKYVDATQGLIDISRISIENSDNLLVSRIKYFVKEFMKAFINQGADTGKALIESWKYLYNLTTIGIPEYDIVTYNISIIFILLIRFMRGQGGGYNEWKKLFDETKAQNTFFLGKIPLKNFIKFVLVVSEFDDLAIGIDMGAGEALITEKLEYPSEIKSLLNPYCIEDIIKLILEY